MPPVTATRMRRSGIGSPTRNLVAGRAYPDAPARAKGRGRPPLAAAGAVAELLAQALRHDRRHELGDVAPEPDELLQAGRAHVEILLARHQEDRLDLREEVLVHQRHLELVLEVRHGANAADHDVGADLAREVDREA